MRVYRVNLFEGRGRRIEGNRYARGSSPSTRYFDSARKFRILRSFEMAEGREREKKERKMNDSSSFKRGMDRCCRCPVDGEIMGEFTYNEDKTEAKVDFQAHKFPYTASVYYQCNVRLCVKHDGGCSNTVKYEFVKSSRSFEVKCFSR